MIPKQQPIPFINKQTLQKLPLKRIFFPFHTHISSNQHMLYRTNQLPSHHIRIFDGTNLYKYCCFVVLEGNGYFDVWQWNWQFRYRFVVKQYDQQTQTNIDQRAAITNQILSITHNNNLYIHNLQTHLHRTHSIPCSNKTLTKYIKISATLNILVIQHQPKKSRPTLRLIVYKVDKQSLNIELRYDRYVQVSQNNGSIVGFKLSQAGCQGEEVGVAVTWLEEEEDKEEICCAVVTVRAQYEGGKIKYQRNGRLVLDVQVVQADRYLINEYCMFTTKPEQSRIRSSWQQPIQPEHPKPRKSLKINNLTPYITQTKSFYIIYTKYSADLLLIMKSDPSTQKYEFDNNFTSKIIKHDSNILNVVPYQVESYSNNFHPTRNANANVNGNVNVNGNANGKKGNNQGVEKEEDEQFNFVYVADQLGDVWVFDLEEEWEAIGDSWRQHILTFHSLTIHKIQMKLSHKNQLTLITDQQMLLCYKELFPQHQSSAPPPPTPPYLSIQPTNFTINESLPFHIDPNKQKQRIQIPVKISQYISVTDYISVFNIQKILILQTLPILQQYLCEDMCTIARKIVVQGVMHQLWARLESVKGYVIGTVWDCDGNCFYWRFSEMWAIGCQAKKINDIRFAIQKLVDQQNNPYNALVKILNYHKFVEWLQKKSNPNLYLLKCTNKYQICKLLGGCPCVYQRLSKFFKLAINAETDKKNLTKYEYRQNSKKINSAISILEKHSNANDRLNHQYQLSQRVNKLLDKRQKYLQSKLQEVSRKMVRKIDRKWEKQFNTLGAKTQEELPDFDSYIQVATTAKPFGVEMVVTYDQQQQYQNRLYNLSSQTEITKELLSIEEQIKIKLKQLQIKRIEDISVNVNEYRQIRYRKCEEGIQKILNMCRIHQLLFHSDSKNIRKQLESNSSSNQLVISIIIIGVLYRIYICIQNRTIIHATSNRNLEIQLHKQSESVSLTSRSDRSRDRSLFEDQSYYRSGPRQLWHLILSLVSNCLSIKYSSHAFILEILSMASHCAKDSKKLVTLASKLQCQDINKILNKQEYLCLVESLLYCQLYRFESKIQQNRQKQTRLSLIDQIETFKFRYSNPCWQKGIAPICKIYSQLLHQMIKYKI